MPNIRITTSGTVSRNRPASRPSGMPITSAKRKAAIVRVSVAPPLSRTTCRTGWLSLKVVPKSRRITENR